MESSQIEPKPDLEDGIGDHVGVLVGALVLGVDAEEEGGHAEEEEEHDGGLHGFPGGGGWDIAEEPYQIISNDSFFYFHLL